MNTLPRRNPHDLAVPSRGYEVVLGALGAVAGAGIGLAMGGIAGAIVGLVIGAAAGWVWKQQLQRLADKLSMSIHVSHFPPRTSKWNKVEYRLFSFISITGVTNHCGPTRRSSV